MLFGTRGDAVPAPELDDLPEGTVVRRFRQGEASQRQVLATPGSGLARIWGLVERHHLRVAWPDAAWAEVAALSTAPGIDDPSLVDLEALPFCTIDNSDSRDLDQALHLARAPRRRARRALRPGRRRPLRPGPRRAVRRGTPRGASFYLPGLSVPMLPRALSEGLVSLNPDVPRRAVVFTMELDAEGRVTGVGRARLHPQPREALLRRCAALLRRSGGPPAAGGRAAREPGAAARRRRAAAGAGQAPRRGGLRADRGRRGAGAGWRARDWSW
ncbi:MAG: RNB domain-containing ribonuclease [Deltaproteobacteria bacterium]|nr:RNB domain-containing ribonuclease [Deltaproteobacteria bacterium]